MDSMKELSLEEMDRISGGGSDKVLLLPSVKIHSGPGSEYGVIGTLYMGDHVVLIGAPVKSETDGTLWRRIDGYGSGWVLEQGFST